MTSPKPAQSKSVQKRIAAQKGLPNPFDVQGKAQVRLARYGIKWQGENMPICVPFPDGYWTPWHVAEAQVASLTADNEALRLQLKHDVSPLQAALKENERARELLRKCEYHLRDTTSCGGALIHDKIDAFLNERPPAGK